VFDDLQQVLDTELAAKGAIITVRFGEWPLDVPGRNLLHTRISKAIDAAVATGSDQVTAMPELGEGVTGVIKPRREIPRDRPDLHPAPGNRAIRGLSGQCRRSAGAEDP
jgi:hypothetical protein